MYSRTVSQLKKVNMRLRNRQLLNSYIKICAILTVRNTLEILKTVPSLYGLFPIIF